MAHELEINAITGKAHMVYVGAKPWHGLGTQIPADLTPEQVLEKAGLDWTVEKIQAFVDMPNPWQAEDPENWGRISKTPIDRYALVRSTDQKILDVVPGDWNVVQNAEIFEFFNDFVASGDMHIETAGSLKGGQIIWALAKMNQSFELFGGDLIDNYLLMSGYHKYGYATDIRDTAIRVVCANTHQLAMNRETRNQVKVTHQRKFDGDEVKLTMGIAADRLAKYKETAAYLGTKRYTKETMVEYFERVFPSVAKGETRELSRNAKRGLEVVPMQPGAGFAEGSFWQLFNGVTYLVDHEIGRTDDSRLASAWYGAGKDRKLAALNIAVEMADQA